MIYVSLRHAQNLHLASLQNRFSSKELETTTREIGYIFLISFRNIQDLRDTQIELSNISKEEHIK